VSDFREFQDGEVVPGTRYRVTRLIGAGGMGRVYEVEHVVLKALQRELSRREDLVARLRNEWRALARLEHPNIVNVTDAGTSENGVPFYVMERLEGETLSALLHRQRRLVPKQALAIAAGILDGLHAAHQIGVVHRDVKPPNIFLTATAVKVLDFGIAKIKDAKDVITARGLAVGTPRYMSPEQAQGSGVDPRSDIYATGLMLFEMVSGVGPFDDARDHNELLLAHLGRPAPPLSSISVVAPELDAVVAAMLAKDPRERPPSARHIADTLRAMSQRYALYPATEAPTVNVPRAPVSEPPTRVEGQRRAAAAAAAAGGGAATRPDGVAAHGRSGGDTTTVQPAFEIATTAQSLPIANVTLRLPDAPAPASAPAPTFHGPDTLVDPLTKVPTGVPAPVERTEMLLSAPFTPGGTLPLDPGPTRTAVPIAETPNLTPPPVVPVPSLASPPARSGRGFVVGGIAVAALLLLVVGGLVLRREQPVQSAAEPPPEPATVAVAAAPAAVEAPTPQSVPVPTPPEAAPSAAAEPAAQPNSSAAPSPSSRRVTIKKYSEKRVLLAPPVAASAPVATPASAPPGRRNAAASMPGSGL
jgi:serine/threonine-protein kinase